MNFLEKDLETIIWENYLRCAERGLDIGQEFFQYGKAYRQMNLMPYGIADLVYIRFSAAENLYYVQVIELKRGKIDTAAYMQAKRYQTAIFGVLDRIRKAEGLTWKVVLSSVIIGNEVELAGDFVFCLNTDHTCSAYTYSYGFDGIAFKTVGKEWVMNAAATSAQLLSLDIELLEHYEEFSAGYADYQHNLLLDRQQEIQEYGDHSESLLITPTGVLLNRALFDNSELGVEEGGEDGAH